MVNGLAVYDGVRPAGIVADHAADIGPTARGYIGREHQAVGLQEGIELIEHQARLNPNPALVRVELQDPTHVFGKIDMDRRGHRLAGQTRAAAAGQDSRLLLSGNFYGSDDIGLVFGHD